MDEGGRRIDRGSGDRWGPPPGSDRDPLTGLCRAGSFQARVDERCRRFERSPEDDGFTIALVDIVGLRSINRDLGQEWGDELLRQVAARLESCDMIDLVARVGGDEFAVLGDRVSAEKASQWVRAIKLRVLHERFWLNGADVAVEFRVSRRSAPVETGMDIFWRLQRDAIVDSTLELQQRLAAFRNMAMHDPMTGLLNRRGMHERLSELDPPFSLGFVDLDDLKTFNALDDLWEAGDNAINSLADRLRDVFSNDNVARWGGDEFFFVSVSMPAREVAELLTSVLDESRREVIISGRPLTFSAGVTDCDGDLDAARSRAEVAAKDAKTTKARIVLVEPSQPQ